MNVENASSIAMGDDADERRKNAMERELEEDWARVKVRLGTNNPDVVALARNSYWLGVTAGVRVTAKAMQGGYLR